MCTKKILLIAMALTGSFVSAQAQQTDRRSTHEPSRTGVAILPKIGVSASTFTTSSKVGNLTSIPGFVGGVAFPVTFDKWFTIQPELLYIEKGGAFSSGIFGDRTQQTLKYLEIPVLARINLGPLYVNAGPSVSFNLEGNDKPADPSFTDGTSSFRQTDFGVQFGGGLALAAGVGKLTLDARYGLGLTNVNKTTREDTRNRAWAFTMGYAIPLSGQ